MKQLFKYHYFILSIHFLIISSCGNQTNAIKDTVKVKGVNETSINNQQSKLYNYNAGDVTTNGLLDQDGNMWFTTLTEGIYKYDGSSFINITTKDGLCSNKVNAVIEDSDGLIWFATAKGLCSYNGLAFTNFPLPQEHVPSVSPTTGFPSSETEEVISLIQDRKGDFWLGTNASGAYHFDGETFTSFLRYEGRIHPERKIYNNCIQSIIEDNSGNIWLTSQTHGGIYRYDGKTFTNYTKEDGLSDDMIFSSFKDKDGNLWFGTLDNGLISYKDGSFSNYKEKDWQNVSCFYQDKTGKLWIGSFREETVYWFDGEKFTPVPFDKNHKLVELRFITGDSKANIWFGGRYGILWRYDGNELKDFTQTKRIK